MKLFNYVLLLFACTTIAHAQEHSLAEQQTSSYLESIRTNEAELRAFFHRMPKGGDLHNHFTGSVYAETYFDSAAGQHFFLDTTALVIYRPDRRPSGLSSLVSFDSMSVSKRSYFKNRLIQLWSAKDFSPCSGASDAHFFATFRLFGPAVWGNEAPMLQELKHRAISEHVGYLELMMMRQVPRL